jgi:hypothetical protein
MTLDRAITHGHHVYVRVYLTGVGAVDLRVYKAEIRRQLKKYLQLQNHQIEPFSIYMQGANTIIDFGSNA